MKSESENINENKRVELNEELFKASIKKSLKQYVEQDLRNHYGKALTVSSKLADIVIFKENYVELNKNAYKLLLDKYNKSTEKSFQAKFGKSPYTLVSHLLTAINNVFGIGNVKTIIDEKIVDCLD